MVNGWRRRINSLQGAPVQSLRPRAGPSQHGLARPVWLCRLTCSGTKEIRRKLGRVPRLTLSEEKEYVSRDIATFTKNRLADLMRQSGRA